MKKKRASKEPEVFFGVGPRINDEEKRCSPKEMESKCAYWRMLSPLLRLDTLLEAL